MEWEITILLLLAGINNICTYMADILTVSYNYWGSGISLLYKVMVTNLGNILIYTAGILWGIELIPQILKTYRTKNVEGLSLAFFIICLSAYIAYTIGNVLLKNWNIIIAHIPSLVLFTTQLIMILKYRKRVKNEKKKSKIK